MLVAVVAGVVPHMGGVTVAMLMVCTWRIVLLIRFHKLRFLEAVLVATIQEQVLVVAAAAVVVVALPVA
ncbi:MAG: hypothetical protein Q7R35_13250 [Elusimicrobiota bacterium]|nr:hypothetical protein [Elusimicrobiota bacterium]